VTNQGKFGYPYCPICDKELEIGSFWSSKKVRCGHCGTNVTVAKGMFKPKIKSWEAPEELQSELQQGEGIFCTKCGHKLRKGISLCSNCGNKNAV
jgi:DNA-directed RNA polymerase subunit RPC12/RpoP